ncbi:MAG: hypothetical protein OEV01_00615 [Nitrospira sp.]|nr:hypothetical protein [Nitrospira sp.]MDH4302793.1 hypothetical protein [Nitrospira sp.]MDH5192204.1 hypothetical protein [Nitrospira sp.]
MWMSTARRTCKPVLLVLVVVTSIYFPHSFAVGGDSLSREPEFSGYLVKRVNGKQHHVQVFGKGDRLRLEYKYAIRTELGFAAIEIIRVDLSEVWYLLPQQRELLVMPLTRETIPIGAQLVGETQRTLIGPAVVADRPAQLFDIRTELHGIEERFYEWVDEEMGVVLKLVNQDHDWSFQYERIRKSPQPARYFDEPPGYQKRQASIERGAKGKG